MQDKPVNVDVDAASLAKRTAGFSGAELSNLVNEAALSAGKGGLPEITSALLDDAQDKVLMGSERRSATSPCSPCIQESQSILLVKKRAGLAGWNKSMLCLCISRAEQH